jgi:hypothetical protein
VDPARAEGEVKARYRLGSLDRRFLRLKFGPQLPFSLKPVSNIVTMLTAARDVDLKRAVRNFDVGLLPCRPSDFGHYASPCE